MTRRAYPYSAGDLRYIADQIDAIEKALPSNLEELPDGHWAWGVTVDVTDDGGEIVGQHRPHPDGWYGFYPHAIEEDA